jgi:two-component system phosphate regulon sensor histidine kinase PhoR
VSRALRLRPRPVFKSRFLWAVYSALAAVLVVSAVTMVAFFLWTIPDVVFAHGSMPLFRALAWSSLLGIFVALGLGWWLTKSVRQSLTEITTVAQALTAGDFQSRVRRLRNDEFGLLALTLNLLGEELSDRMATLSQERAQLQAMLASLVEGIIAFDDDNRILFSNSAAERFLNVNLQQVRDFQIGQISGLGVLLPAVVEARTTSNRVRKELSLGSGSQEISLELHAARFRGDQGGGVVIVLHDVTDLRRLERVRRDFVANVSHELKTPLTSVKGYIETLQMGAKDDPEILSRFLVKIEQNVSRLVALVQDILSLARVENEGAAKVSSERVEWLSVVKQVMTHHEHELIKKNIRLELLTHDRCFAIGDREAMTQITDNLVSNAIKYTPESGSVKVKLSNRNGFSELEVADSGVGIGDEHLPRIFERFYRVDKARSRELGGTGLGLSIVKHLVSAMNGRVTVKSKPGEGSVFTVALANGVQDGNR